MGYADEQVLDGMDVFDLNGTKVGKVVRYDKTLGYFETQGTFSGPRYIPFSAIERLEPAGAYLNVTKAVVSDVYNRMPSVTPELTPEGKLTGGGTVQSGRTGRPVPLDAAALSVVREKIHLGSMVLDADNQALGTVEAYDGNSGYMLIEKGGLSYKDFFLPVTAVSFLDEDGIHLSEDKETIMTRYTRVPEVAREFFEA